MVLFKHPLVAMVLFQVVENAWCGPAYWWNFCDAASTLERLQFEGTVTQVQTKANRIPKRCKLLEKYPSVKTSRDTP